MSTGRSTSVRAELLTCKVCGRLFNRHEHLRRHSRTHTKEKPYACPCGRSFTRKDLLTRHERLSHSSSANTGTRHSHASLTSPPAGIHPVPGSPSIADGNNGDTIDPPSLHSQHEPAHDDLSLPSAPGTTATDPLLLSADSLFASQEDPMLEFGRFMSSNELNMDWETLLMDPIPVLDGPQTQKTASQLFTPDSTDFSSRVPDDPSGDEDFRELKTLSCTWLISEPQRLQFNEALAPFQHVIPKFTLPTRLSIARYMSGFVDGFSNHHPFIHVPTLSILAYHRSPEMILALLAIGAQYRYETKAANALYQAGRSIMLDRLHGGDLHPPVDVAQYQHASIPDTARRDYMDRTRAVLLLATYCSWQSQAASIQECLEYQGLIARSIRATDLSQVPEHGLDWAHWASLEMDRRTMFFGWCLMNLQSFAYDSPPLLLSRELDPLYLPCSCQEWTARGEAEWLAARARAPAPVTFKEAHASHLAICSDINPVSGVSPTGAYVLIYALLQRIYLTQQLSADPGRRRSQDVQDLEQALNRWRHTWRTSPESLIDLQNSYMSISFTSTALLGAAHIRLHCDLGQWRRLQTGDPSLVATTLLQAPAPQRGPHLIYALLHSVHALNIPAQLGISYLSRCQSFSWSIHHAFCDLECAVFLSKWLQLLAESQQREGPLSGLEHRVLRWIIRVVREALLSQDETVDMGREIEGPNMSDPVWTARQLSYAVVKVWAQMFKSCNGPWPVVGFIGQSLDQYAELNNSNLTGS